jgi:hypothetical protein
VRKEGKNMTLHKFFAGLFLAGMVLGSSGTTLADDSAQQQRLDSFELVAVDYCYRGSTIDPSTREIVDLYTLCSDDAIEGNLDLA